MIRKVNLWGNGLGLKIPKTFAKEIGLKRGSKVKMTLEKGKLVIQPAGKTSLKALVDQITPENSYEAMASAGPRDAKFGSPLNAFSIRL